MQAALRGPRNHLQAQDRVAADGEEIVVDTDGIRAQHGAPDRQQFGFLLVAWRTSGKLAFTMPAGLLRVGQGAPVDLAVQHQRQRRELHQHGRHHVGRQACFERIAQRAQIE
ncbi:hypothetical protein R69658_02679 [Paraburkholderia aspalathi]|uniref:Uncharacterized protein n=1 Tax=Paraburkholderia aspalathi TaxID=1324617 RepID=A0ABM8RFG5_9BURK|nr:hypothetical protein R69658_02679 [Paraburkholderia aspalathi]